ncbi:MAG: acyl-CoA dehydrogenase [Gammaproteobacteria bacterium]|nr:acyl-CoA dehydrogenase [Gammaproteobacteria bacterium]MYK84544.1 acyl-CoA dehydrogenase [Gammaproteobacteria bacterium]
MDFGLSEEQTLFQDALNNFLADQVGLERVRRIAGGEESAGAVWAELAELGVSALLVPEAHGGVGLKPLDAAVAAECLGHHATPSPFLGSAVMGPTALLLAGGQGERLERLAAGELRIGVALGEAIAARAEAGVSTADGKLNGKALYVLDYGADEYLVADSSRGLHLVAAGDLEHRPLSTVEKTRPTGELVFDNSPAIPLSADPAHLQAVLDAGRVMLAADTLGAAQNMLDQAVAYAKEREQFNRPIGSFQAVKHMCAEMAAHLEPCRAMVWYAGHALSEVPEEAHLTACHAKAHLAEVGTFVARTATEVHGGMGFTDLLGLHYWFKRIGFNRQALGAPELVREEAARAQQLAA